MNVDSCALLVAIRRPYTNFKTNIGCSISVQTYASLELETETRIPPTTSVAKHLLCFQTTQCIHNELRAIRV